jgi:hypothetical protein
MNKKLTISDFKREGIIGSFGHYFSHTLENGMEICLGNILTLVLNIKRKETYILEL